ncbi:MAG TPA: VWA domain-containing protein [Acidimicrobiia bacterium]|jgi:Ca-activated chloride channel family protein|nr:von Willebrand factor [Acidimicrobiia bacterium]HYJ24505.1 VWA domain-containing protein [Acidimicrobiia bacterium]
MSDFGFLSPGRLAILILPVALTVGYLVLQARRRRYAVRFTTVEMLDHVAPDRPGWRRHLPAIGLIVAAVVATMAFARPVIAGETRESTQLVVLAIDTSISMEAEDVSPSRVDAAREAAGAFLDAVPEGVAVGVVGFDGVARNLISPTTRIDAVRRVIDGAINHSGLGEGTAIGEAVFLGIDAIEASGSETDDESATSDEAVGTIVVLSDGETTMGRTNDEAATAARSAGIPVHTIAFGTDAGTIMDPFEGEVPVPVNEEALAELARQTDGKALTAASVEQLSQVYEDLGRSVTVEKEQVEIGDWFAGAALALLSLAGVGSLVWFGRLP